MSLDKLAGELERPTGAMCYSNLHSVAQTLMEKKGRAPRVWPQRTKANVQAETSATASAVQELRIDQQGVNE